MSSNGKILVILGPTSSGKSDIAIKLAKKFNGEIISADSRQIYRGMDIGTGKVEQDKKLSFGELRKSLALRNSESLALGRKKPSFETKSLVLNKNVYMSHGILHYMIDVVSPCADYNVAKFKKQAEKIIKDILKCGKLPIICGGTGFWIQAIVDNVQFPEVKPDWKLRKKLKKHSINKLFAMLKKLDPQRAKKIDAKNKVRLTRAIEIAKYLGKVPKILNTKYQILDTRYKTLQLGIGLPKEKLHKNIERRIKARFSQGMIKEVRKLRKQGLSWKKIQSFGLAYFWIPLYLQNKISKAELTKKIIQAEKNYAKRQMTWFQRDKRIKWLKTYREIEKQAKEFLK